jgi:hypothetical protein
MVAVHGLNGDAKKTWTHKKSGHCWLEDSLAGDFPGARVITFGYNSTIAFSNSKMNLEDFARDLLNRLQALRKPNVRTLISAIGATCL